MRIAIVGCGFVADFYVLTLPNHPELELIGVADRDPQRVSNFASFHSVRAYESLEELLADERVELVLNLTNPGSHYEVTKVCLQAGKHVYSEKPIAMNFDEAVELVELAKSKGVYLTAAPCNVLSETAQTVWKSLREKKIGKVRLVYAELDDGLIHRMRYAQWKNAAGVSWPWKDEFEVGCTLEHAGYYIGWLTAFFGPAETVTSFASCLIPDKETELPLDNDAPDFSAACIQFRNGVVARLTCSIVAPHDHQVRIFGDDGVISVKECWNYGAPVYVKQRTPWSLRLEKWPLVSKLLGFDGKKYPLVRLKSHRHRCKSAHMMDFARGVAELASAAVERRPAAMTADFALHVNEIVLAIQFPEEMGCPRQLQTTFEPMAPLPWVAN